MTLILTMVNKDQAVLVSDRRLTADRYLVADDSNKAGVLVLRDARLAVAFSGLAKAPGFVTSRWLALALMKAAPPDHLASRRSNGSQTKPAGTSRSFRSKIRQKRG